MGAKVSALVLLLAVIGTHHASGQETSEASSTEILTEQFSIRHNDLKLSARIVRLADAKATDENSILLLPSATYSTVPNWDLQHDGASVMRDFARAGWVVFALDLPGYGSSDDPPEPRTFGAKEAAEYIDAFFAHVEKSHDLKSANVIGWSWGAQVAGYFAAEHPEHVRKLVLYGFTPKRRAPEEFMPVEDFRRITLEGAMSDFIPGCYKAGVPEAYAAAVMKADDAAPSGPLYDFVYRLPLFGPDELKMPVMVVSGQYEVEQPPHLEADLSQHFAERRKDLDDFCEQLNAGKKSLQVIAGGGHAVHLEKPRDEWRTLVKSFLQDSED